MMSTFKLTDPYAIELYHEWEVTKDSAVRAAAILRQRLINEGVDPDSLIPIAHESDIASNENIEVTPCEVRYEPVTKVRFPRR
jgi:hypothetical protein